MFLTIALAGALAVAPSDTIPVLTPLSGAVEQPVGIGAPGASVASVMQVADDTVPSRRRKAVEVSDMYELRLKIHYLASYATIPIFAAQAVVGEQLYNAESQGIAAPKGMKGAHDAIAVALGVLFAVNTVTGAWNWWETRSHEKGRTWRTIHAALMLVADAGFAYTASIGSKARGTQSARDLHRNWAEGSA